MKVIKKSKMPNGTYIQIEDWREDYPFFRTLNIATYPKAKNTSRSGFINNNETFRLGLTGFENDEQVKKFIINLKMEKLN